MPKYKDPVTRGFLWIEFEVEMPLLSQLSQEQDNNLKSILEGSRPPPLVDDDTEEVEMKKPNILPDMKRWGKGKQQRNEDDEEEDYRNMKQSFFGARHQQQQEYEEEEEEFEEEDPRGHHRGGGGGVPCAQQ